MKYILGGVSLLALFACASTQPAQAQQSTVVTTCGSQSIPAGQGTSGSFIDNTGNLCTNATGGSGSNAAAGATGSAVPASGSYNALNVAGTLRGQTGVNPTGSVYAAQTDISSVGGTAVTTSVPVGVANGADVVAGTLTDAASCASGSSAIACFRQLHTDVTGAIPAQSGHGVLIGAVEGSTASGVTVTDNPLLGGGRAATAAPTAVTDGQKVANLMGETGKQVILPYSLKETAVRGTTTSTDTSAHTIIASAGGSLKNYITGLQCGRTDAGATAIVLTLSDAASTVIILPSGGATNIQFAVPLATAAATAFQFTSGTGVSTAYCSAQGYTGL